MDFQNIVKELRNSETSPAPELLSDQLSLIFLGRTYEESKVEAVRNDVSNALLTERVCPHCTGLEMCKQRAKGQQAFFNEQASDMYRFPTFEYRRCRHWLTNEAQHQEEIMLASRFQQRSFESFQQTADNREAYLKCKEYAAKLDIETKHGLLIIGNPGTGKTHLAASILRVALLKSIASGFVVVPNLLDEIRNSFKEEGGSRELVSRIRSKRLIVLDDLGKERATDWVSEELYKLINFRYEQELPTIITSNRSTQEMEKQLGYATVDRLAEMCRAVPLTGPSWRRKRA